MTARDDGTRSARQIARGKQRKAGDRSARLAATLMKLPVPTIKKLVLEEDLRDAIDRARRVTTHIARRRAERTLAGDLRRFDLPALELEMNRLRDSGAAEAEPFHLAEQWRTRMIAEGVAALATFPAQGDAWPRLIAAAQRERDTGKPPGASRALFRQIVEALKLQRGAQAAVAGGDDDAAEGDGDGNDGGNDDASDSDANHDPK
jgi:ribosome-associated protein